MRARQLSRCRLAGFVTVAVLGVTGCTSGSGDDAAATARPTASPTGVESPTSTETADAERPAATTSTPSPQPTEPPDPVSLQALMQREYDGRDLRLNEVIDANSAYTRYFVAYASGDLTISGVMNIPAGDGPFPVLVLAHGYIDPAIYTNGRGLAREQDYLARNGFAVLHTDYRNHAQSDDDPDADLELRLGYTEDVINAVLAIRASDLPQLDDRRIGLLGRSMGGGVTYNVLVAQPGLVDAAVVYAPVSSNTVDNFERWTRGQPENAQLTESIIAAYGAPETSPEFWANVSPITFFDRVTEPVLVQHGTADDTCPLEWSQRSVAALQQAGADAELVTYEGEPHAFEAAWPASMERTVAFFNAHLTG